MADNQPVTWRITGVTQDTQYSPTASPIPGKRVAFTTSGGYDGSLFVPDTIFGDKAAVADMVAHEVQMVADVQAISGTLPG